MSFESGISLVGSQRLINNGIRESDKLLLLVDIPISSSPSKIGFLWLVRGVGFDGTPAVVILPSPLWTGGVLLAVPPVILGIDEPYDLYVDWNLAGVSWTALL